MEQHDVERIIRGVLGDLAAPFRFLDVERTPTGWHAMLKQMTGGRVISVRVPDGPPTAIRTTVMQSIEAETAFEA
jgi:hypothetical protein